jgi:RsiW-degrading membrane proteinase PrsW (M82 family)
LIFAVGIIAAIFPALLLAWYFYSLDAANLSRPAVVATFALGLASVIPVGIIEVLLMAIFGSIPSAYGRGAARAFLAVAPAEELSHFMVLVLFCARHGRLRNPLAGMIYGAIVALGFATAENVGYTYLLGFVSAMARAYSAVLCHAFFGAIMGYYIARARCEPKHAFILTTKSLLIPIVLHGLWDFPALTILAREDLGVVGELRQADLPQIILALILMPGVMLFLWLWTLRINRRLQGERASEVETKSKALQESSLRASPAPQTAASINDP